MNGVPGALLVIGESDVGKTHYGAQVLRRLNVGRGAFELVNAENMTPFNTAMERISQGLSAPHTPRAEYSESTWVLRRRSDGSLVDLIWPDYGGEQISGMIDAKSLSVTWRDKLLKSAGWIFMIRPSRVPLPEDILTRAVTIPAGKDTENKTLSPQSKLVELLQMLHYKRQSYLEHEGPPPPLAVLLSCYDELGTEQSPREYCHTHLPMLDSYLLSNWPQNRLHIFAVSPLGQALSPDQPDMAYVALGPETQGYIVNEKGCLTDDLLAPVEWLLSAPDTL